MKWAVILCGLVVTWLLNAWFYLLMFGVLHSWWTLMPTMGWHTSLIVSGLVVVGVVVGRFIGAFVSSAVKDLDK